MSTEKLIKHKGSLKAVSCRIKKFFCPVIINNLKQFLLWWHNQHNVLEYLGELKELKNISITQKQKETQTTQ